MLPPYLELPPSEFLVGQEVSIVYATTEKAIPAGAIIVGEATAPNKLALEQVTIGDDDLFVSSSVVAFIALSRGIQLPTPIAAGVRVTMRVRYVDKWPPQQPGVRFKLSITEEK